MTRVWAVLLGAATIVAAACGDDAPDATPLAIEDPGVVHVHGLGVNPADGDLYAATHTGLFRITSDGDGQRIADRHQDTMGFTVVGPNHFVASGHPDSRDKHLRVQGKPPLLGLIATTDAGKTWRARALLGEADLHTIVQSGETLVAYDSTGGRVLASTDEGATWETRSTLQLLDLAVDPADAGRVAALDTTGRLLLSVDGGRSWTADPVDRTMTRIRWSQSGIFGGDEFGMLHRRPSPEVAEWTAVRKFDGTIEALSVDDDAIYVAVMGSGIFASADGGRLWDHLYAPPGEV